MLAVWFGCYVEPQGPRESSLPITAPAITLASPPVQTIREQWRDLAIRFPGFGGVWRDSTGALAISSSSGTASIELRQAVSQWLLERGRPELASQFARIHLVRRDYVQLDTLLSQAQTSFAAIPGINSWWIDETDGRVHVGTEDQASASSVRAALLASTLPAEAIWVDVTGPSIDISCSYLRSTCSPMRAGLGITDDTPLKPPACTIGFVGYAMDSLYPGYPDTTYRLITTASHCTFAQGRVDGDQIYQPEIPPAGRHVGVEADDAPIYPHATCAAWGYTTYNKCRYADVAVIHLDDSIAVAVGSAAISQPVVPNTNPPYLGSRAYTGSNAIGVLTGDSITSIGSSGGERKGKVTASCMDTTDGYITDLWNLCQGKAAVTVYGGDSGGLIYVRSGQGPAPTPRPGGTMNQKGSGFVLFSHAGSILAAFAYRYFLSW